MKVIKFITTKDIIEIARLVYSEDTYFMLKSFADALHLDEAIKNKLFIVEDSDLIKLIGWK